MTKKNVLLSLLGTVLVAVACVYLINRHSKHQAVQKDLKKLSMTIAGKFAPESDPSASDLLLINNEIKSLILLKQRYLSATELYWLSNISTNLASLLDLYQASIKAHQALRTEAGFSKRIIDSAKEADHDPARTLEVDALIKTAKDSLTNQTAYLETIQEFSRQYELVRPAIYDSALRLSTVK